MKQAIVTNGYLYAAALTMMLYAVWKGHAAVPTPLDRKAVPPILNNNAARICAMALGLGLGVVAMLVWAGLFPASGDAIILMP